MKRHDWVVFDMKEQAFRCNRCGSVFKIVLPASVTDFCAASRSFEETHKKCEERDA